MNRGSILLRVDGSTTQGMGRVARCLALANALQRRRYQMTFISQIDNNAWPDRIRRFRHATTKVPHPAGTEEDKACMLAEIASRQPVVVITDSPAIDEDYLALLGERVPLVISLDESAAICNPNKLVIHPSLARTLDEYSVRPDTQVLAGERYVMIRSEFRRARSVRAIGPGGPPRVLIAIGGGEVGRDTLRFARALLKSKAVDKVDAVLGIGSDCRPELDALGEEYSGSLSVSGDVRDMGARMSRAHLLITGGGNTALEAACVGIPMLLIAQHSHHESNAAQLEEHGVAQYLGSSGNVTPDQVVAATTMSRSGRMLIDGRGPDRIVTATELLLRRVKRAPVLAAA